MNDQDWEELTRSWQEDPDRAAWNYALNPYPVNCAAHAHRMQEMGFLFGRPQYGEDFNTRIAQWIRERDLALSPHLALTARSPWANLANNQNDILSRHALKEILGSRTAYDKFYQQLLTAVLPRADREGAFLVPNYLQRVAEFIREGTPHFGTNQFIPVWERAIHADCKATWSPGNGIYEVTVDAPAFSEHRLRLNRIADTKTELPNNPVSIAVFAKLFASPIEFANARRNHALMQQKHTPSLLLADENNCILVTSYSSGIRLDTSQHQSLPLRKKDGFPWPDCQEAYVPIVIARWIDDAKTCSAQLPSDEKNRLTRKPSGLGASLDDFISYAIIKYDPALKRKPTPFRHPIEDVVDHANHKYSSLRAFLQEISVVTAIVDNDIQTLCHGDLHPGNVLITSNTREEYTPVFLDFENLHIGSVHTDLVEILKKMRFTPEQYQGHLKQTYEYLLSHHSQGKAYEERGFEDFKNRHAAARFIEYLNSASKYLLLSRYAPTERLEQPLFKARITQTNEITAADLRDLASVNYTEALNLLRNGSLQIHNKDALLQTLSDFNTEFYKRQLEDLGRGDMHKDCYLPHPNDHRSVSNAGTEALRHRYLAAARKETSRAWWVRNQQKIKNWGQAAVITLGATLLGWVGYHYNRISEQQTIIDQQEEIRLQEWNDRMTRLKTQHENEAE